MEYMEAEKRPCACGYKPKKKWHHCPKCGELSPLIKEYYRDHNGNKL